LKLTESFGHAISEMLHHKLRTLLTLLGMVFGVGAVIAMLSIGEGAKAEAMRLIESMGLRNLLVNARQFDPETLKEIREDSLGLNLNDRRAITDTLPFVDQTCAEKSIKTYDLFSRQNSSDASVLAVSPNCFGMSALTAGAGRLFDQQDDARYDQVAVIGSEVAATLFPNGDAVGGLIKVNHLWLRVIGVLASQTLTKDEFQGIKLGAEQNRVYMPLSTAFKRLKFEPMEDELDTLRVGINTTSSPQIAALAINRLINRRHGQAEDFEIVIPAALLNQQQQTQRIFTIVMSCIAGISLLVGGIGIMNIMLATVLERTSEIGLLRALGARKIDIQRQFLVESATIAALGAILGIIMGVVLSFIIQSFANWPVEWSLSSILLAVGICLLTGIGFGWYPARRAADLDPIRALQSS